MLFQLSTAEILYDYLMIRHLSQQENRGKGYKFMMLLFVLSPLRARVQAILLYMSVTNSGIYLENNLSRPVPIHTISPRFIDGQVARYETPRARSFPRDSYPGFTPTRITILIYITSHHLEQFLVDFNLTERALREIKDIFNLLLFKNF